MFKTSTTCDNLFPSIKSTVTQASCFLDEAIGTGYGTGYHLTLISITVISPTLAVLPNPSLIFCGANFDFFNTSTKAC